MYHVSPKDNYPVAASETTECVQDSTAARSEYKCVDSNSQYSLSKRTIK